MRIFRRCITFYTNSRKKNEKMPIINNKKITWRDIANIGIIFAICGIALAFGCSGCSIQWNETAIGENATDISELVNHWQPGLPMLLAAGIIIAMVVWSLR
jgi:hypothetical protein